MISDSGIVIPPQSFLDSIEHERDLILLQFEREWESLKKHGKIDYDEQQPAVAGRSIRAYQKFVGCHRLRDRFLLLTSKSQWKQGSYSGYC